MEGTEAGKSTRNRAKFYAVLADGSGALNLEEYKSETEMRQELNRDDLPEVKYLFTGRRLQASKQSIDTVVVEPYAN